MGQRVAGEGEATGVLSLNLVKQHRSYYLGNTELLCDGFDEILGRPEEREVRLVIATLDRAYRSRDGWSLIHLQWRGSRIRWRHPREGTPLIERPKATFFPAFDAVLIDFLKLEKNSQRFVLMRWEHAERQ